MSTPSITPMFTWLRQTYCGFHGHDDLRRFARNRVFLECTSCGHESPGWEIRSTPAPAQIRGDARLRQMTHPHHLVDERRVA